MFKEFKEFISRGSVLDMAIGVVMGSAFKAIIDSVVGDIIMPIMGTLTAGVDFKALKFIIKAGIMEGDKVVKPEIAIGYGNLIQMVINFLIISLCLFLVVKSINKLHHKKDEVAEVEPVAEPVKSDEVLLLEEIRDVLKAK